LRISRVGVIAKINSPEAADVAARAGRLLRSRGVEVVYAGDVARLVGEAETPLEEMAADLAVIVGGDGTIMRTEQKLTGVPLFGIKVGALGFLCEATTDQAEAALERILAGSFYLEHRSKLKVSYRGARLPDVLNEVLVTTAKPSKILSLSVTKDGEPLHRGKSDGAIISTTTGATAYALSAGGPIVDPRLDIIELVFICPLSVGLRPMLLPVSSRLEVKVLPDRSPAILVLDGQTFTPVDFDEPVAVEKSERSAVFARVNPPDFYRSVSEKIKPGLEV